MVSCSLKRRFQLACNAIPLSNTRWHAGTFDGLGPVQTRLPHMRELNDALISPQPHKPSADFPLTVLTLSHSAASVDAAQRFSFGLGCTGFTAPSPRPKMNKGDTEPSALPFMTLTHLWFSRRGWVLESTLKAKLLSTSASPQKIILSSKKQVFLYCRPDSWLIPWEVWRLCQQNVKKKYEWNVPIWCLRFAKLWSQVFSALSQCCLINRLCFNSGEIIKLKAY